MKHEITMATEVTLKQAYQVMFDFLDKEWQLRGESKTDQLGAILSNLLLYITSKL